MAMIVSAFEGFSVVKRYRDGRCLKVPVIAWSVFNDDAPVPITAHGPEVLCTGNWNAEGQAFLMMPDGRIEMRPHHTRQTKSWSNLEAFVGDEEFLKR